jgi:hypothetical protein
MKPNAGMMRQDLRGRKLRKERAGGGGDEFPLRVAKVTSVDPLRRTCSLYTLTGNGDTYDDVPITAPAAGARHFLGGIPEVNDLCIVGYAPAESGYSRTPYIERWLIPGVDVGYDWITTSPTRPGEVEMTPALREALQGSFGRRRHKLRQMNPGNIMGSSSQGSDLLLSESVYMSNRRGNELWLRDQDQALVTRTLQQFHAGAGVRAYSGMVQRDATLLPTQLFTDSIDWEGDQQVDEEGKALTSGDLDDDVPGRLRVSSVFDDSSLRMGRVSPQDTLRRGLFIDAQGLIYDDRVRPTATYGGKPLHRVSIDGQNGVPEYGEEVFTEWRWELSHTADGTLPVTEQTDGIDIDRLLPSAPQTQVGGAGDPNPLNRSPRERYVEMVMGTVVGNDPINDRDSYGIPLVPRLYDDNGNPAPAIVAADPLTPITDHIAWMVRAKNPTDPKAPEAFMAVTKGGAFRSYFPGSGSKGHEEFFQTGRISTFGQDKEGVSSKMEGSGTMVLKNTGRGRPSDNLGVEVSSEGGAVLIYAGAASTEGAASLGAEDLETPAQESWGLMLRSAKGSLIEAREDLKLAGQRVRIEDTDIVQITSNSVFAVNSNETASINTKSYSLTTSGKAEYTFGGPKNSLPTNGPARSTFFTVSPLTGGLGGVEDSYEMVFGGRSEVFRLGRHDTDINVGSYNIRTMGTSLPSVGTGSGIHLATGLPGVDNTLDIDLTGVSLTAKVGTATLSAVAGAAVVSGSVGVSLSSVAAINMTALAVQVTVPTTLLGGVLTDGCLDPLTGRPFLLSGTIGVPNFRVG